MSDCKDDRINGNGLVERYIGSSYDTVKKVSDNLEAITRVADNIELEKGEQGVPGYTPEFGVDYFNGRKGDFTTYAFRNSINKPDVPGGGSYNGLKLVPPLYWVNDPETPVNGEATWVTITRYIGSGVGDEEWINMGWSEVARFSGNDGATPAKGIDYFDGIDGSYVSFIYTVGSDRPDAPVNGAWNGEVETIPIGWYDNPPELLGEMVLWLSTARYKFNGAFWVKDGWSVPERFSGTNGDTPIKGIDYYDGASGIYTSYVFYNAVVKPSTPEDGSYKIDANNNPVEVIPFGWADDPSSPYYGTFTWITKRQYKQNPLEPSGPWLSSSWSEPAQFSGNDGAKPQKGIDYFDGDTGRFTSFVFHNSLFLPAAPQGGGYDGDIEDIPEGWFDDPSSPLEGELTWVSQTYYSINENGEWVNVGWSIPTQFNGTHGLDGAGAFNLFNIRNTSLTSNSITSVIGVAPGAAARSVEFYGDEWAFSVTSQTVDSIFFGAWQDQGAGFELANIDYGFHLDGSGILKIIANGVEVGSGFGAVENSDSLSVQKIGTEVYWFINGDQIGVPGGPYVTSGAYAFGALMSGEGDKLENITIGTGLAGSAGRDSKLISISSTSNAFTYDFEGNVKFPPGPNSSITLFANRQNVEDLTTWSIEPVLAYPGIPTGTDTITLLESQFAPYEAVTITVSSLGGLVSDKITIVRLSDGLSPAKGVDYTDSSLGTYRSYRYLSGPDVGIGGPTRPNNTTSYDGVNETGAFNGYVDDPYTANVGEYIWVTSKEYSSSIDPVTGEASWDENNNSWSEPAKYSYIPKKGVDYFDGGSYVSYVFRTELIGAVPSITGGSYDGTVEVVPNGWSDNPTFAEGNQVVWVSMNRYSKLPNSDSWSSANFGQPTLFTPELRLEGYLTNESHTVPANSGGNNVDLAGSGGRFWVYMGSKNVTALSSTVYSVSSISGGANITIDQVGNYKVISMGAANVSIAVFVAFDTASNQSTTKTYTITKSLSGPQGIDGARGTRRYYRTISGSKWYDGEANKAITDAGDIKMDWDIVTLSNKGAGFTETRYWLNGKWNLLEEVIDGDLLVDGTVIANKIKAGAITTSKLEADIIIGKDAEFKGTLTAAKGSFTGSVTVGSGSTQASLAASGSWRMWAGATAPGSAPFRVYKDGRVWVTNLNAKGTIEASTLKANVAMVNTANIRDLAVDTLQIKGGAVTATVFGKGGNAWVGGGRVVYSPTITFYPSGGGYIVTGTAWGEAGDNDGRVTVALQIRTITSSTWSQVNAYYAGVRVDGGREATWELPLPVTYADGAETRTMQARMKFYDANANIYIKKPLIYAMSGKK